VEEKRKRNENERKKLKRKMKMNGRKRMMKDYNNVLDFVERVSKKYFRRTNKMSLFDIVD